MCLKILFIPSDKNFENVPFLLSFFTIKYYGKSELFVTQFLADLFKSLRI